MAEPHGPFRRHAPKLVLSLVIAALFVWLFHRGGLPLLPGRDALATIRPGGVALYVALSTVGAAEAQAISTLNSCSLSVNDTPAPFSLRAQPSGISME